MVGSWLKPINEYARPMVWCENVQYAEIQIDNIHPYADLYADIQIDNHHQYADLYADKQIDNHHPYADLYADKQIDDNHLSARTRTLGFKTSLKQVLKL